MKKTPGLIALIAAVIYFIAYTLTRLIFLDRPFDPVESITGAVVFGIIYYLFHKYIVHKLSITK